jgi:hypothetical protein
MIMRFLNSTMRRTQFAMASFAVALGVPFISACSTIKNPGLRDHALQVPEDRRAHVHAIFLNSQNDPLGLTNFRSIFKFAQDCGFLSSRYHHFNSGDDLAAEVRDILHKDPLAKICLIGWSGASLYAFDAAGIVAKEKIVIDEIIYLDSNWIKEQRLNAAPAVPHPKNVNRVAMCYSKQRTPPTNVPNPVVYQIPVEDHTDVASHPRTGEVVVNELIQLANRPAANRPR